MLKKMKMKLQKTLDAGIYEAQLSRIEEVDSKFGAALKFIYITDSDDEVSELVNPKYSAKSKLGKRAFELLGGELPEELELDDMIGKRARITLIDQDGSDFAKVQSVKGI